MEWPSRPFFICYSYTLNVNMFFQKYTHTQAAVSAHLFHVSIFTRLIFAFSIIIVENSFGNNAPDYCKWCANIVKWAHRIFAYEKLLCLAFVFIFFLCLNCVACCYETFQTHCVTSPPTQYIEFFFSLFFRRWHRVVCWAERITVTRKTESVPLYDSAVNGTTT